MELNKEILNGKLVQIIKIDAENSNKLYATFLNEFLNYQNAFTDEKINEYYKLCNEQDVNSSQNYLKLYDIARKTYSKLAPFSSELIKEKYKEAFSVKSEHLIWFVSFKEILKEIERINNQNIVYLPYFFIISVYFQLYLPSKISRTLASAFKLERKYDGYLKPLAEIGFFKYFQNMENRIKKGEYYSKNEVELFVNEVKLFYENNLENEIGYTFEEIARFETSGRVEEIYIKPIFNSAILLTEISENDKLILFYDLFRLLMRDKGWPTEEEFNDGKVEGIYSNNYRKYKLTTMRKFIYKK